MLRSDWNYSHSLNLSWNKSFENNTPLLFSLFLFFSYAIIFLIGLLANLFVIVMIIKRRRRRTLTNRFLLNLAISDLLATLICLPPTAYHYYDKRWIFGEFLCRSIPFMQGERASCLDTLLKRDVRTEIRLAQGRRVEYGRNRIRSDAYTTKVDFHFITLGQQTTENQRDVTCWRNFTGEFTLSRLGDRQYLFPSRNENMVSKLYFTSLILNRIHFRDFGGRVNLHPDGG